MRHCNGYVHWIVYDDGTWAITGDCDCNDYYEEVDQ